MTDVSHRRAHTVAGTHAEPVGDGSRTVRWVLPVGAVPFAGPVVEAPAPLAGMLAAGVLTGVELWADGVLTTLASGRQWRDTGDDVRAAVLIALADPDGWVAAPVGQAQVADAVTQVLAGPVGRLISVHDGSARLVGFVDGVARLEIGGACAHCPASGLTFGQRFDAELRRRLSQVRSVEVVTAPTLLGRWLGRRN